MKISKLFVLGMLVVAMAVPNLAVAETPEGCTGEGISLHLTRTPTTAHVGDTITYTIYADVEDFPPACAIDDITLSWIAPDGTPEVLIGPPGVDLVPSGSTAVFTRFYVVDVADLQPDDTVLASATAEGIVLDGPPNSNTDDFDEISVLIITNPNTLVGITADPVSGLCPVTTNLEVTEQNTGDDPLTDVEVLVQSFDATNGLNTITTLSDPPDSGDTGNDGVLGVGETWTWNTGPLVGIVVGELTTFYAIGSGIDPLGNEVSFPTYQDEKDQVDVDCTPPEPCVEVTKEVDCDISKAGDTVTYHYCIHNCGPLEIAIIDWIDTVIDHEVIGAALGAAGCDMLAPDDEAPGGPDECCFDVPYVIPADDPFGDPIVNGFAVLAEDTQFGQQTVSNDGEFAMAEVDIVHPSFIATKDCRTDPLEVGDTAIFDIRIENDGDVCLRFDLTELGAPVQFDLAAGDVMEWETHILVETEEDITNTIIGTATLIPGDPPGVCGEPNPCLTNEYPVEASDTCEVGGGASRTPGYWKNHTYMAECMFDMCYPDGIDFGWTYVDSIEELMAIFHAKKAILNKLCQARLQLSFHMGAAILNNCLPNGLPFESHTGETFAGLAAIMAGCDVAAIKAKIGIVGGYNEYGDEVEIIWPEGMCDDLIAYNATPAVSKEWAGTVNLATLMGECEACGAASATVKVKGRK